MLKRELLHADTIDQSITELASCYNARGQYVPMHFVLRLRPDIHKKLENITSGISRLKDFDFDTLQAFSTYFHETIHWWQHIGSTSGFTLTMSYPSQTHINTELLKKFTETSGKIKSVLAYNEKNAKEFIPSSDEFIYINQIINNFYDIEFFKLISFKSELAKQINENKYFESWGHCNIVTLSTLWSVISSPFDDHYRLKFTPNITEWNEKYYTLMNNKAHNFYHGCDLYVTKLGVLELYEGQARFSQMQYLYLASGSKLTWEDFDQMGMLSGEYYVAFNDFLKALDLSRPDHVASPVVGLFLLLIDIAINPSAGFPFEIEDLESLAESVNPGYRFYRLCQAINEIYPELKTGINEYSIEEYTRIATILSHAISSKSPLEIAEEVSSWTEQDPHISELMEQEKTFSFSNDNFPIRVLLSRFIKMKQDKLLRPDFFCWPGMYLAGEKTSNENVSIFAEHQSLFCDREDGDIYARLIPGKPEANIKDTFESFYTWMSFYQLCRQWITTDGPFDYDFLWLTSKHSNEEIKSWVDKHFSRFWGFSPDEFEAQNEHS